MNSVNGTSSAGMEPVAIAYFHRSLKRFGVIYMALVIVLGFIGNSVSSYVFIRSKLK